MYLADAPSQAYLPHDRSQTIPSPVESINMTQDACLKPSTLQVIKQHTLKNNNLQGLIKVIKAGGSKTKGGTFLSCITVLCWWCGCLGKEVSGSKITALRPDLWLSLCTSRSCQQPFSSKRMHLPARHAYWDPAVHWHMWCLQILWQETAIEAHWSRSQNVPRLLTCV